jgi:hypothetical protein
MISVPLFEKRSGGAAEFYWLKPFGTVKRLTGSLYAVLDANKSGATVRIELLYLRADIRDRGFELPRSENAEAMHQNEGPFLTMFENGVVSEIVWPNTRKEDIITNTVGDAELLVDQRGLAVGVAVKGEL